MHQGLIYIKRYCYYLLEGLERCAMKASHYYILLLSLCDSMPFQFIQFTIIWYKVTIFLICIYLSLRDCVQFVHLFADSYGGEVV